MRERRATFSACSVGPRQSTTLGRRETTSRDDGIKRYVEKIDLDERDFVFGASVNPGELIAAVHVDAYNEREAELGISVDVPYRRTGVGSKLFARCTTLTRAASRRCS